MNGALLTFLIALPSYFVIGFIYASLATYYNWKYPDQYTEFWWYLWLWWVDMLRKLTHWIRDWGDYYERRLREIRKDNQQ